MAALVAALPLFVLLIGLPLLMKPAAKVAPIAWLVTVLIAIVYFGLPADVTLLAAIQGALFGIFPIMYIPFGALVVYNTLKATGWMDKMQGSMANLTVDRRAQALLIGFGFGAFLEGICGFGAPVAIPASILVGLGYDPTTAALVCLVANTGPVPFGSTRHPHRHAGWHHPAGFHEALRHDGPPHGAHVVPVRLHDRLRHVARTGAEGRPAGRVRDGSELRGEPAPRLQLRRRRAHRRHLVARLPHRHRALPVARHEQAPWLFEGESATAARPRQFHPKELFLSWLPYLLLAVLVILVNLDATKRYFNGSAKGFEWLLVQFQIYNPGKLYKFAWLQTPGSIILIAGLIAFPFLGVSMRSYREQVGKTFKQMIPLLHRGRLHPLHLGGDEPGAPHRGPEDEARRLGTLGVKQIPMVATMANSVVSIVSAHVYPVLSPVFGHRRF